MAKHIFSNIGKKARDLLYKNYEDDIKVSMFSSSTTDNGTELTTSVERNVSTGYEEIHGQMKGYGIIYDLKENNSDINHTVTIGNCYSPSCNAILHYSAADLKANKFEVQYSSEIVGFMCSSWFNFWNINTEIISSSFYLKRNPYRCTIGGEMSCNMKTKDVTGLFGFKFVPSPEIVYKARMVWMGGYDWKVSALIKHKLVQLSTWNKSPSYFTISA